jgi:Tol biopolymer transport system component/predicted Ser/Thr protein kinase
MPLAPGTRLGRYEVRSPLGAGGMGEVYLAEDTQLDREVALKILPAETTADPQRLQRFLQEARAASKLKGERAAHIYEIGEAGGLRFIAMEYVEGETLDRVIAARQMSVAEVVRLGSQIAEALDEAHAKGVAHRDIKPSNVVVTPRGGAKVLDFGLAKLASDGASEEAATRVLTSPGAVMGTVSYMSPEQALARADVDARTDIFSLGVVLYEMATGRLPFQGASVTETIDAIVHSQPPAVARFNYDAPAELEVIIKKALRKDREERYQSARDLLNDLRALERELALASALEHTAPPQPRTASGEARTLLPDSRERAGGGEQATAILAPGRATREASAAGASQAGDARATASSAEYVVEKIRAHTKGVAVALALVLLVVALPLVGYVIYHVWSVQHHPEEERAPPLSFQNAKLARLTTTGKATNAAISPDGKYVVHVQDDGGQQSLWMRQTATQSNVEIAAPAPISYDSMAFSPDGNYVYYSVSGQAYPQRVLFQIPTLGGQPKKILENLDDDRISFSPDGRRFAFVRETQGKESALVIADADGANERKLLSVTSPPESLGWPAWSPDGKRIAYGVRSYDSNDVTIFEAQVADGARKPLTARRWFRIACLSWQSDGDGLLMLATPGQSFVYQVWHLSYPGGEARRLTNDLNDYGAMSLTADSKALAVVKSDFQASVWVAPAGDAARARAVTSGSGRADAHAAWTPDGRIVFSSNASGDEDIWIMDADGSNQRQLTSNARINRHPAVSPDGRYIVFLSDRSGTPHLWRMNIDGSEQRQLTNVGPDGEQAPQFSPDGRWLFYMTAQGGYDRRSAWRIAADGSGGPVRVSDKISAYPTPSPDGQWIAYLYKDDENAPWRIAVAPLAGGEPVKTFPLPATFEHPLRWTPDGRAVAYIDTRGGVSNVVAQPADGAKPVPLTDFKAERIYWFDFSRDGRQLALSRGTQSSDVVLISNFK